MKMLGRKACAFVGGVLVGTVLLGSSPVALASTTKVRTFKPGPAHYQGGIRSNVSPANESLSATSTSLLHFTSTATVGTTKYTYSMVGKNPAVASTNPAASIKVELVPVVITFKTTTLKWDPTVIDSCDTGASALARTRKSPLVVPQSWAFGGTAVGSGQATDAFQRAEFWKYAQPAGKNPGYAVNLSVTTVPKITIAVPLVDASTSPIGCGNGFLGSVDINWLDSYLQTTAIPSLASSGVNATTLPVFLLHNVVEYEGNPSSCCVLGYHNAYGSTAVQTYALSMYDNSGAFSGVSDITALSHELGEWMDDPYTNNPTPRWGHVGQVSGCQANLEVGDPLSGSTYTDNLNGFTYHPQELAFFSWFYHQKPSIGLNGWYSDQGTFTSPAAACS